MRKILTYTTKQMPFLQMVMQLIRYNLKVIFGGKFLWFFIAALAFFILLSIRLVFDEDSYSVSDIYGLLMFPGMLLIFYPTIFGIQSDYDARILEILFGIPNYRYKVWLFRNLLIFVITWFFLLFFAVLANFIIVNVAVFEVSAQLMFPIFFLGGLGFMLSTLIRNGNGTAVTIVLIVIGLSIMSDILRNTFWDVFLNPYSKPNNTNEIIWQEIVLNNRIFLSVCGVITLLVGLMNLQRRELFLK